MKNNDLTSDFFVNNYVDNYNNARKLFRLWNNERALTLFNNALKEPLDSSASLKEIYLYIGRIYLRLKNYEEASTNFKKAIQEQPYYIEAIGKLGETYFKLAQYKEAASYCDQVIELNPSLIIAYYNKGNILLNLAIDNNLKDQEIGKKAIECYKKALEIKTPLYEKDICWIYTSEKQEIPALAKGRNKELSKEIAEIIVWKGNVSLKQFGKAEKALADYNKALEIDCNCLEALCEKGQVLIKLERLEELVEVYDKMIEMFPEESEEVCFAKIKLLLIINASKGVEGDKNHESDELSVLGFSEDYSDSE
ncbi:tetratricopeptide repeat protein [Rickettsia endosymbiont of Polydrusus tereticollis]|uniref:tetratricopeptide repeat protein n=1 Tax=Rickettsia endosymbiont of Polydrusus tereticollis TaxID=3066251 RepID=UPI003132B6F5